MKYEDLEEYFESYVKNYCPYKDDKLYKSIIKFLHGYYLKHSYEEIPGAFKTAFETQVIPIEFYDVLLLSNGFPKSLLETLTYDDKYILLNSLMDYNQYKGTISCLKKTVSVFNDNFNVYELFIDYRDTSSNGSGEFDWVFTPYPVYIDEASEKMVLEDFFEFDEIYTKAEHFFINRDQLNELKDRNELLLPIKTNLIMVDQTIINNSSPLMSLFFTIVLKTFRNERFVLYFKDGQYSITLERAFRLWYYIIYKWWGKDVEFTAPSLLIAFILDTPFEYTLADIDLIKAEYEALSYTDVDSGEQVRLFYKEKIEEVFEQFQTTPINYTQEQWTDVFKDSLGKDLIEYVDNRMTNIETGSDITRETITILDEVYNSIITWSVTSGDQDVKNYLHYFTDLLPLLMVQPEKTATFRILNFLKPFHVELTGQGRQILEVNDKFNAIYADERWNFVIKMPDVTLHNMSHHFMQKVSLPLYSQKEIIQDAYFIINHYIEMINDITDEYNFVTTKRDETLAAFSYKEIQTLSSKLSTDLHILNKLSSITDLKDRTDELNIEDFYLQTFEYPKEIVEYINDVYDTNLGFSGIYDNLHVFTEIPVFKWDGPDSELNISDKFEPVTILPSFSLEYIQETYKFDSSNISFDTLHILGEIPIFREVFEKLFGEIEYIYRFDTDFVDTIVNEIINNHSYIILKDADHDTFIIDVYAWYRERFFHPFEIEYNYRFDSIFIENTIEEILNIYNYNSIKYEDTQINIEAYAWYRQRFFQYFDIYDNYHFTTYYFNEDNIGPIDDYIQTVIMPDEDEININNEVKQFIDRRWLFGALDVNHIYPFITTFTNDTIGNIIDNYNYIINTQAVNDTSIEVYAWYRERFKDIINIDEYFIFDISLKNDTIVELVNNYNYIIQKEADYDNMVILDKYIFVERFFDTVYNSYLYTFNTSSLQSMIFSMHDLCDFIVQKIPEYDNIHIFDESPIQRSGHYDYFNVNTTTWDYKYFPVVAYEDFYSTDSNYYFKTVDKDRKELMEISHDFNTIKL
jgi:hypothetical protein